MQPGDNDIRKEPAVAPQARSATSEETMGKWMVAIGLGIAVLLVVFVKSTKDDAADSTAMQQAGAPLPVPPSDLPAEPLQPASGPPPDTDPGGPAGRSLESIDVLGQRIVFANPSGYCTPGESEREVELVNFSARTVAAGGGARLAHTAVLCSELDDYKNGRRNELDHWLQIQLIGPKGNFKRLDVPREAFLSGISKTGDRLESAKMERALQASLETHDVRVSGTQIEPIGRDGNAFYMAYRMNMVAGGKSRPINGLGAITLLNALPLSVNVYEGTGSAQGRLHLPAVQQELLNSLLTEN